MRVRFQGNTAEPVAELTGVTFATTGGYDAWLRGANAAIELVNIKEQARYAISPLWVSFEAEAHDPQFEKQFCGGKLT